MPGLLRLHDIFLNLYYTSGMTISVRLPPKVEQKLAEYCASHMLTRSEAVKRALDQLFDQAEPAGFSASARRFAGSDKRPGDIARHTKRLLRQQAREK